MYFIMKKKPNSKIAYSLDPYMVTSAEYIQIIAAMRSTHLCESVSQGRMRLLSYLPVIFLNRFIVRLIF
jgi:hypothetical protein